MSDLSASLPEIHIGRSPRVIRHYWWKVTHITFF